MPDLLIGARESVSERHSFFIEAIVNQAPPSPAVDVHMLERKLGILKRLMAMGYSLAYQDELSILCEAEFPRKKIECESLKAILAGMP